MSKSVLITGGIGDVLAWEPWIAPEDRLAVTEVYLATRAHAQIQTILQAMPLWANVQEYHIIERDWDKKGAVHRKNELKEVPSHVEDLGIWRMFDRIGRKELQYHEPGYAATLTTITHSAPVAIHAHTMDDIRAPRHLTQDELQAIVAWLEHTDQTAIVIGSPGLLPASDRLIDLQGKTGVLEAIEITKQSRTFFGVDSCWTVVASRDVERKLYVTFPERNRWHLKLYHRIYYAPRTEFSWLTESLLSEGIGIRRA